MWVTGITNFTAETTRDWLQLHPFNGLFSRTTWVSRYQKAKTSLDLNEARDYGVWDAVASAVPCADNLHLTPDRQPHQHLMTQFLQAGYSSLCPINGVKALKAETRRFIIKERDALLLHYFVFCVYELWLLIPIIIYCQNLPAQTTENRQ